MTDYGRILLAGLGSTLLLAGALISQYFGGLAPCTMCIWQRWPHAIAIGIAILAVTIGWKFYRQFALLGAMASLVTAGIGIFHAGVEQKWWEGPSTCTAPSATNLSPDQFLEQLMTVPLVRCDDIVWQFGLTMAGWNGVFSLILAAVWLGAARTPRKMTAAS